MEGQVRKQYNAEFSQKKYDAFKAHIAKAHNHQPPFRLAETPVFIGEVMKQKLFDACLQIMEVITHPSYQEVAKGGIPHDSLIVPNEDGHTRFLQMDFGICKMANGELSPQLIEVQGFPSLYFFQHTLSEGYKSFFKIPNGYSPFFGGLNENTYIELLRDIIVGSEDPKQVVLLEIEPEKQVTQIDFWGARDHLGIKVLCVSKLRKHGNTLYYINEYGQPVNIKRIFNRVIFDELLQRPDLKREFSFKDEVDVEWVGHPNWFYKISKYTMPFLKSEYVPECHFLHQLTSYPSDLENYVLKPLYSFAGSGVMLHVKPEDLNRIKDKSNFILQRKVNYHPVIETPTGPAKVEIRMLMLWEKNKPLRIVNNLVRLSKGEMIGVRYNLNKDWVGASAAFFKQ